MEVASSSAFAARGEVYVRASWQKLDTKLDRVLWVR